MLWKRYKNVKINLFIASNSTLQIINQCLANYFCNSKVPQVPFVQFAQCKVPFVQFAKCKVSFVQFAKCKVPLVSAMRSMKLTHTWRHFSWRKKRAWNMERWIVKQINRVDLVTQQINNFARTSPSVVNIQFFVEKLYFVSPVFIRTSYLAYLRNV
jgi:hypothetical protein